MKSKCEHNLSIVSSLNHIKVLEETNYLKFPKFNDFYKFKIKDAFRNHAFSDSRQNFLQISLVYKFIPKNLLDEQTSTHRILQAMDNMEGGEYSTA